MCFAALVVELCTSYDLKKRMTNFITFLGELLNRFFHLKTPKNILNNGSLIASKRKEGLFEDMKEVFLKEQ